MSRERTRTHMLLRAVSCFLARCIKSLFFCSAQPTLCSTDVELKVYRTETTLCVPDPVFGHNETHVLLAPPDVPVQRILLSSLANQGLRNGGGVQFEVWCRYSKCRNSSLVLNFIYYILAFKMYLFYVAIISFKFVYVYNCFF